jgi:hypothetical protein
MITWVLVLACFWLLFNWAAGFSVLTAAQPISRGRLPAELLHWDKDNKVRFYVANLVGGYGFSLWAPPFSIVIFDRDFFAQASPPLVRFVIAHELAHFTLGHHRKRWFAVVFGLVLLPAVRRWLQQMEHEADQVAFWRTESKRSSFPQLKEHA